MTRMLTSWLGSWESSGSLPELSTAAGPLLLLVLGQLPLDSMLLLGPAVNNSIWWALHVHYALCFCRLIIPEITRHIRRISNIEAGSCKSHKTFGNFCLVSNSSTLLKTSKMSRNWTFNLWANAFSTTNMKQSRHSWTMTLQEIALMTSCISPQYRFLGTSSWINYYITNLPV